MSGYVVLARKYRSKQFSDIVGQRSVVRTLVNAIRLNRTHQAYVFSGSRGIGKTSIARIFSKALRCPNVQEKEGLLFSCDHCSDCTEITAGISPNVIEIDGASNNGVDSIREIRDQVRFLPATGKFKIYIIDEVHMLSTAAFNALLKTLEEPPEHIVFIFATTEAHKIPETILGRCQRFDFKRVTVAQVTEHLKEIAGLEGIEIEAAALSLIARAAEGSMRDALSILDQVISFAGNKITAQAVRESVGLIGTEMVFSLLQGISLRNVKDALQIVQMAFNQGVDLKVLLKSLQEMLHALILQQVGVEKPDTHFSDDELKQISTLGSARPLEENELIFQVLHHGLDLLSRASQPKLIFDLLVIKTAAAEVLFKVNHDDRGSLRPSEPLLKVGVVQGGAESPHLPSPAPVPVPVPVAAPSSAKTWEGFNAHCFKLKPVLAILLESVVEWVIPGDGENRFKIGFREKDKPKADQLMQKPFRDQLLSMVESYFGARFVPEVYFSQVNGESVAERAERLRRESHEEKVRTILSNEVVQEARALFGAELTGIEIK